MRFRDATPADIPAIVGAWQGRNALPLAPRTRTALPALLSRLLASPACTFTVFEEEHWSGPRLVSFAGGLFLAEEVVAHYLGRPRPALLAEVFNRLLDGDSPLLSLDGIRRANADGGLPLAVLPIPFGGADWDAPATQELRRLAPLAFLRNYGGYRLREIYYEVFADEPAAYLQAAGYACLHDFAARADADGIEPGCRPRMLRMRRDTLPSAAMSVLAQAFDPPRPLLGLTLAEQRVALRALDGAADRQIAAALGLSPETVRSQWRSIYRRLAPVLADLAAAPAGADADARGFEKRRVAIEYLRQNLHELRPTRPPSRRGADR